LGGDRVFLFGRRTYEQLLSSWNNQGGPFKDALNNTQKYVASHSPATRLEWPNSTLLDGHVPAAVAELKQASSGNLVIMGSGELIAALMAADLIDEYLLMIHPSCSAPAAACFLRAARIVAAHRLRHHDQRRPDGHLRTGQGLNHENPFQSAAVTLNTYRGRAGREESSPTMKQYPNARQTRPSNDSTAGTARASTTLRCTNLDTWGPRPQI
jgi:dihydrofolate reductase